MTDKTKLILLVVVIVFLIRGLIPEEYSRFREKIQTEQRLQQTFILENTIKERGILLARVQTPAHRILKKRRDQNLAFPREQVIKISEDYQKSSETFNVDQEIQSISSPDSQDFYGFTIPQKWGHFLFGYRK